MSASPEHLERAQRALEVPLLRLLGARLADVTHVADGVHVIVGTESPNAAGILHGGAINTLLDVAAYLAVVPVLAPEEEALTHAFSASYLTGASPGDAVVARGDLLRRTRRLAFVSSELRSRPQSRRLGRASSTSSRGRDEGRSRELPRFYRHF